MRGLECSEVLKSDLEDSFRIDSEFFQKKYTFFADWVKTVEHTSLLQEAQVARKGIFDVNASYYASEGIPFVRISNLRNMMVDIADIVHIPKSIDIANFDTHLSHGDIILSKTAIPAASFVNLRECNVSKDTVAVKLKVSSRLLSEFLVVFFNTKYGLAAMERRFTGNVQMHLNLIECKEKLLIPVFSSGLQQKIKKIFLEAMALSENAGEKYKEAETLLLSALKLDTFTPSNENTSVKTFSQFTASGRLDAEYYQQKYDEIEGKIKSYPKGYVPISEYFCLVKDGFDKQKKSYPYIEIGDVSIGEATASHNIIPTEKLPDNAKIKVQAGDILISKVRPNRGAVAIVSVIPDLVVSGAFCVLRSTERYSSEVLLVLLKSAIYREWLLKWNVGTSYPVIKDENVCNLLLPLLPEKAQQKIAEKIRHSFALREKSKALLNAATRAVEIAIEQDEAAGRQFLREKERGT